MPVLFRLNLYKTGMQTTTKVYNQIQWLNQIILLKAD